MTGCDGVVKHKGRCAAAACIVQYRIGRSGFKGKLRRPSDRYGLRENDLNYDRRADFVGTVGSAGGNACNCWRSGIYHQRSVGSQRACGSWCNECERSGISSAIGDGSPTQSECAR